VDLKESVRFGKDIGLSRFFETIRQMRFEMKDRSRAKDYLSAIKSVSDKESNVLINPVDDVMLKGDVHYARLNDCVDYSYRFIFRIISDLVEAILGEEITIKDFLSAEHKSFKSKVTGLILDLRSVSIVIGDKSSL